MTQDEIIEMANQAELCQSIWIDDEGPEIASLVAFVKLVAAKEREACAKVCEALESNDDDFDSHYWNQATQRCGYAIRARGEA